jgi:hypothetical protein
MNLANITICTFLQPMVGMVQTLVDFMYLGLNVIGVVTPPVITWFQPLVPCTLT